MKNGVHTLAVKINHGLVLRGPPGEIERVLDVMDENLGEVQVVFHITSGNKLKIIEKDGGVNHD